MPCSSPHCCPSCLTPSYNVKILLYPSPLIKGLDPLGRVVTAETPGTFVSASMILVLMLVVMYRWSTETIGIGLLLIWVAWDRPVTTTGLSSMNASERTKSWVMGPPMYTVFIRVLKPT